MVQRKDLLTFIDANGHHHGNNSLMTGLWSVAKTMKNLSMHAQFGRIR